MKPLKLILGSLMLFQKLLLNGRLRLSNMQTTPIYLTDRTG